MKTKEAVILAGGKSSRMKFDKQKIRLGQNYMVFDTIEKLKNIFDQVTLVTNTAEFYDQLGVKIIGDIYPGHGPISGIHSALVNSQYNSVYVMAVDMPVVNEDYIMYIDSLYKDEHDGVAYENDGFIEPMHGIYNTRLVSEIENNISKEDYTITSIINRSNFLKISHDQLANITDENIFINLNDQDELKRYKSKYNK